VLSIPSVAVKEPEKLPETRNVLAMGLPVVATICAPAKLKVASVSRLGCLVKPPCDLVIALERLTI
jgi:hypothetical protein